TEFKDGFGRPEWKWPEGVPKLKTLAQIFKEQGGFEELGTIKGAEMVGWKYEGPFDELKAQQQRGGTSVLSDAERKLEIEALIHNVDVALQNHWISTANYPTVSFCNLSERIKACLICIPDKHRVNSFFDFVLKEPDPTFDLKDLALERVLNEVWLPALERRQVAGEQVDIKDLLDHLPSAFLADIRDTFFHSGVEAHRVIRGGRDSRGNANVVAGEGTGIVHIAPGCGDIDHKMGVALGFPVIAPLKDDGTYSEKFGDFADLEAIAPATAERVFEKLKDKGMLVAVETYPHIYPHCWRTGDELVFRLVDEWFINMDWRDEIKDVTKQIKWLPDSIDGQDREIEWLSNMSDWMISKKRFWGLALPIWVNEEDPSDFEVMGSLAELKERSIEGWGDFEGNTPHRPWIDGVIIESQTPGKEGQRMRRIPDVGNPWLDAGIVPFSTMGYNTNREEWQKWYPADLVTECFPGQFRNWFYSMLSLSTMMMYDEADNAADKKPFRTLLGHRLVQNEQGKPMHKSDGTAIWFEEAAEQIGVDTMRWMYLSHNPAADLRFGTRHPDKPVTLQTPEGPISHTKEGVPTATVTSGPADETRRQILIPLWNCYKFFVDYAIADGFVPSDALRRRVAQSSHHSLSDEATEKSSNNEPGNHSSDVASGIRHSESDGYFSRPEIDRWILSNLQSLIDVAHREITQYNAPGFCAAAAGFIDDLSNWYIRRNRRRFWRSKDAGDADKNAAYETLYEVLVTLCRLLAPCMPFLTERMYQNLVLGIDLSPSPHKPGMQKSEIQKVIDHDALATASIDALLAS
ncbi:MAG TPA: class I tRNA ligase family protein, partial [Planctomycetaceae bacterium]|nr:class I tRNA ligase family protein [Planctomycetaceae bacterium]